MKVEIRADSGHRMEWGCRKRGMHSTYYDHEISDCVGEVHEKPLILVEKVGVWFSWLS